MQQQHVVRPAFREHFFDMRLDDMRGLVTDHLHGEVADLRVAEHSPKRLGIGSRGPQILQCALLIGVIRDDQGHPLAAHCPLSPITCLLTNKSISRA